MISLQRSVQLGRIQMLPRAYPRWPLPTMQRTWLVFCMLPSSLRRRQSSGCQMMVQASPAPRLLICRSIMIFVLLWIYGPMMMCYVHGGRPLLDLDHGAHEISYRVLRPSLFLRGLFHSCGHPRRSVGCIDFLLYDVGRHVNDKP